LHIAALFNAPGKLLPHLFTLTSRRFFSAALSLGLPPTDVIRYHFLRKLRLSSLQNKATAHYPCL